MQVNLDHIEFYDGPPCPKPRSESTSTRKKQSWIPFVKEPIHRALPIRPVSPPDSPALILSANGPERLTLQSHDQLPTSRAEPCNVFDIELGKLYNGTEWPPFESTETTEENNGCLSNGGLDCDNPRVFKNVPPSSGKLYGFP